MYKDYPNSKYNSFLEETFGSGIVDILEKDKIIVRVDKTMSGSIYGKFGGNVEIKRGDYRLGAKGLELVSSWNVERLTEWIIFLTIILSIFGVIQLII